MRPESVSFGGDMADRAQVHIDTRAIELAAQAQYRVESHEAICEVRHAEIQRALQNMKAEFTTFSTAVTGRFDKWMYALLGTMVLSLGYFIVRFGITASGH